MPRHILTLTLVTQPHGGRASGRPPPAGRGDGFQVRPLPGRPALRWRIDDLRVDIPLIVSNHPDCAQIAADEAIAYVHLPVTAATKLQQEQVLRALITQHNVDLVVLSRAVSYLAENRVLLVGKKTVVFP